MDCFVKHAVALAVVGSLALGGWGNCLAQGIFGESLDLRSPQHRGGFSQNLSHGPVQVAPSVPMNPRRPDRHEGADAGEFWGGVLRGLDGMIREGQERNRGGETRDTILLVGYRGALALRYFHPRAVAGTMGVSSRRGPRLSSHHAARASGRRHET